MIFNVSVCLIPPSVCLKRISTGELTRSSLAIARFLLGRVCECEI